MKAKPQSARTVEVVEGCRDIMGVEGYLIKGENFIDLLAGEALQDSDLSSALIA